MRITADTNLLLRVLVRDDPDQAARAQAELADAQMVVIPITALIELVWVLARIYHYPTIEIVTAIKTLTNATVVQTDRTLLHAGLAALEAGCDFRRRCDCGARRSHGQ